MRKRKHLEMFDCKSLGIVLKMLRLYHSKKKYIYISILFFFDGETSCVHGNYRHF